MALLAVQERRASACDCLGREQRRTGADQQHQRGEERVSLRRRAEQRHSLERDQPVSELEDEENGEDEVARQEARPLTSGEFRDLKLHLTRLYSNTASPTRTPILSDRRILSNSRRTPAKNHSRGKLKQPHPVALSGLCNTVDARERSPWLIQYTETAKCMVVS